MILFEISNIDFLEKKIKKCFIGTKIAKFVI